MSVLATDQRESVVCLFCGFADAVLYARAKSHYDARWFQVVRCRRCGLVYTNPRIANKPREIESQQRPIRCDDPAMHGAAQVQLRRLERFCHVGRLLDFGCGEGVLVHEAVRRGWDAYGLELSRDLVKVANAYWGDARVWGDPLEVVVKQHGGSFDAIISTQVFEHLSNPLAVLRGLCLLLKPGGVLLIDVPNLACLAERRKRGVTLDPTAHLYYFTRTTLRRLFHEAGLGVVICHARPNNYGLYRRVLGHFGDELPIWLATLTDQFALPDIGKGVVAVGVKRSG